MSKQNNTAGGKSEKKILQAVVLADSFARPHRFRPFTKDMPKVLLPLMNVPMLEYTLEFLATNGVEEIIVVSCAHSDQISDYLKTSRWANCGPDLSFRVITSPSSNSMGDALRHVASDGSVIGDFVLISGDVVANIDLKKIVDEHKAKSALDTDMIMTMVFNKVKPHHAMRALDDDLCVAVDRNTNQLLRYSNNANDHEFLITEEVICDHPDFDLHYDLLDSHIVVCNSRILQVFEENFDYSDLRSDFVRMMLARDESDVVANDKIFVHITSNTYAARIQDWRTYHTVSHDILRTWLSPIIISANLLTDTTYTSFGNNVYRERGVDVHRGTQLMGDIVLGRGTVIGKGSVLSKLVCGRDCLIGSGVKLTTSYLMEGVRVGDNSVITGAVIGKNVTIGKNVRVCKGAIIGNNVVIDDGVVVPSYITITADGDLDAEEEAAIDDYEDYIEEIPETAVPVPPLSVLQADMSAEMVFGTVVTHASFSEKSQVKFPYNPFATPTELSELPSSVIVGPNGRGRVYIHPAHETLGVAYTLVNNISPPAYVNLRTHATPQASDLLEFLVREEDDIDMHAFEVKEDPLVKFFREVDETLARGHAEHLNPDDIVLELSGCKFAAAQNLDAYAAAVVLAWFQLADLPKPISGFLADPENQNSGASFKLTAGVLNNLTKIVSAWRLALQKFCRLETDQREHVLPGILYACMMNPETVAVFPHLLKMLFELNVLSDDAIVAFYENRLTTLKDRKAGKNAKESNSIFEENFTLEIAALTKLKPVVEWLLEDDEDEEEDEDEE